MVNKKSNTLLGAIQSHSLTVLIHYRSKNIFRFRGWIPFLRIAIDVSHSTKGAERTLLLINPMAVLDHTLYLT